MSFTLPKLNYDYHELEPSIDRETMEIHHSKHHAGYIKKLNATLEGHADLSEMTIEDLLSSIDQVPEDIRQNVINNGGGHANHSLFWEILSPDGGGSPSGDLADAINKNFDSFDNFKEEFSNKALSIFGSGWAFLIAEKGGKLSIKRHSFQNTPLLDGKTPIFALDVWEHAYYLKYQNNRANYIEAFWDIVDWNKVSELFEATQ